MRNLKRLNRAHLRRVQRLVSQDLIAYRTYFVKTGYSHKIVFSMLCFTLSVAFESEEFYFSISSFQSLVVSDPSVSAPRPIGAMMIVDLHISPTIQLYGLPRENSQKFGIGLWNTLQDENQRVNSVQKFKKEMCNVDGQNCTFYSLFTVIFWTVIF